MQTITHSLRHLFMALLAITLLSPTAQAQTAVVETDCAAEIAAHCSNVLPGAGRIVACLIAHENKISPRCRMSAYLASGDLDERLKVLRAAAKVCSADILQYCSKVPAGGGRIYDCLKSNKATLTDDCRSLVPQFQKMMSD
jgi:hypothetical protein